MTTGAPTFEPMAEGKEAPDLVITGARVVTRDSARRTIDSGGVAVTGTRISAVGSDDELSTLALRAARHFDASGHLLCPGLVNLHCHTPNSLFRGLVEDLALEPWLDTLWKAEKATLTPETTRLGAQLGLAENLLAGVTTVMDMFWFPEEGAQAAVDMGVRVSTGGMAFDGEGMDGIDEGDREDQARAFVARFGDEPLVVPSLNPHATYTVGPEGLEMCARLQEEFDCLLTIHAAETRFEQRTAKERFGKSVIRVLEDRGLLGSRTVLAHCVHLDEGEIGLIAESGTAVAHNPVSNLKIGSGVAPIPELLAAGARVGVGTDGAVSGNDLDIWMALRLAAILHKGAHEDPLVVTVDQALAMVTDGGAAALGLGDEIGSLEVGKSADLALLELQQPYAVPLFDPEGHLVFSAGRGDVRQVFVRGRQVVADREILTLDLADVLGRVDALAGSIAASVR